MKQASTTLEHMPVREIIAYEYDDMIAYIGVTAFLSMTTVLLLILSV